MTRSVPHGWKEITLDSVLKIQGGYAFKSSCFQETGIPIVRMSNLKEGKLDLSEAALYPEDLLNNLDEFLLADGDVVIGLSGSIENYAEIRNEDLPCYLNQRVGKFQKTSSRFFYPLTKHIVTHKDFKTYLKSICTGAQVNLSPKEILAFPILLPTLPEQEGIAAVLGSVDATIDATKQVIAQTRQLKRAVMQTLLTRGLPGQHTQFKPSPLGTIPADWEVVKLGSCVEFGPQNGLYKHASHYGSGTYIVRIDDFQNGRFIRSSNFKRTDLTQQEITSFKLDKGDFLINRVNSLSHLGKAAIVPDLDEDTVFESNMMRLKFKQSVLNVVYANYWFLGEFALQQIKNFAKIAVAQCSISQQDVSSFLIPLPPLPEQEAIVGILNTVDARLARETETLTRLQTLKTALMQVLLTGEVRVPAALGMSRPAEYGETSPIAVREIVRQGSR